MPSRGTKPLFAIAILAFCLRVGYAAATGALRNPQEWEQEKIATNLVERHAFLYEHKTGTFRSYTEPLYPFLAAAVYVVTDHSRTALVLLQLVIAAATVWMTGRAAERASGDQAVANVAALLIAVHPGFIHYSSILHPFVLDSFFFIAAAAAILCVRDEPTRHNRLLAALVIGLGALTRPTILVFLAPLVWTMRRSSANVAQFVQRTAVVVATALAVLAPWAIRNALVQHTFMLTRSGTGFVLWLGHNPASTGSATDDDGRPLRFAAPPEFQRSLATARDEVARDRIFSDAAWTYIRSDPGAAVGRVIRRLGYFWWFSPQWGRAYSPNAKLLYRAWWLALLAFIAIGFIASRRHSQRHALWMMAGTALLISVVQSIYYVEGRHRLAIEPLITPLAAFAIVSVARRWNLVKSIDNSPRTVLTHPHSNSHNQVIHQ